MLGVLFVTTLVVITYILLHRRYNYWKNRNVPFCKPNYFTGNIGDALNMNTTLSNICLKFYNDFKDYRYVGFFNMWTPAVLIRDPELIKDILVKGFNSYGTWFVVEDYVDPILAVNPFVLHGPKWKSIRSILTSQFTSAKIKNMVPNIQQVNEKMISFIKKEMSVSKSVEVLQLANRFTSESVMTSAFGVNGRSLEEDFPDSVKIAEQICSTSKITQIKQTISMFFPILRKILKVTFIGDPVPKLFKSIIKNSLKYRTQNEVVRKDYLGYLSEMKKKLLPYYVTDDHLTGHAFTFFLDGFDTSASALTYALFELTQNEDVQNKVREEIKKILDKHNQILSYEALQEMKYVECIVFETLRKYPIIKIMARVCLEDVEFPCPNEKHEDETVLIKKGTEIFISNEGIHMDDKHYPNPEVFDPDRFKEESKNSRHKYSFLGFGDGPKICLGRTFALTQIKMGLIAILSEFNLDLNKNTVLPLEQENIHLFMVPKSKIWIDFVSKP